MSDFPPPGGPPVPPPAGGPAPGWWQASDGNWYPPEQQPGYAQPAYGAPPAFGAPPAYGAPAGYGYGYAAPSAGTNGLAIASLVLGIIWIYWIGSILAVIFGHIALSQIKKKGQEGKGLAVAGLVLGYLGVVTLVLLIVFAVAVSNDPEFQNDFGWAFR